MPSDELRANYARRQREAARSTTLMAGLVAIVAFPLWTIFDRFVLPTRSHDFTRVRVIFEALLVVGWLALWWRRIGPRWPEASAFVLFMLPEVAISWMIPRASDQIGPYLLGLSLAIYTSAFLVVWRWQLTALLVLVTGAVLAACCLTADDMLRAGQVATIVFYLGTAGTLAVVAQVYRNRTEWQRFIAEAALNEERDRNAILVDELNQLSRQDPLTGVGNRRAWEERTISELLRARSDGGTLSVIVCDVDDFKSVNDTFGHSAGDRVLQATAALLVDRASAQGVVIRLGGDEFCLLCPDMGLPVAQELAQRIAESARALDWPTGMAITLSMGVAQARPGDVDPDEVLQRADRALYDAKVTKNAVRIA